MAAIAEDKLTIQGKKKTNVTEGLAAIARETGKNPLTIGLDFWKLKRGRGKLRFYEYLMYALYDQERWAEGERERFISGHVHWPTVNQCNNGRWWAVTEDKWLSSAVLGHCGVPIPQTRAVFHRGRRMFPDTRKLATAEDIRAFLTGGVTFPLFAKAVAGMWSAGAVRLLGCTETHVQVDGKGALTFEELADSVFAKGTYIIQDSLVPHAFFEGITEATATVRCLNLVGKDGLSVPFVGLKLPLGNNVADNFWRPGNLICNVDPETGEILTLVGSKDGRLTYPDTLPGTERKLVGERLPDWESLRALNEEIALIHAPNRFGSTDIALTENGPVIVEVNNGCAFSLPQIATGKGLLTDEMLAFFADCGVKL